VTFLTVFCLSKFTLTWLQFIVYCVNTPYPIKETLCAAGGSLASAARRPEGGGRGKGSESVASRPGPKGPWGRGGASPPSPHIRGRGGKNPRRDKERSFSLTLVNPSFFTFRLLLSLRDIRHTGDCHGCPHYRCR
jgi:hypothetical protein